jgi:D-arginine utilization repressor
MRQKVKVVKRSEFAAFLPIGAAISALLYPHAEVVLHDLRTDRVVALWNAFSKRKPGDPSLLGDIADQLGEDDFFGPYEKANIGGEKLKSVSAVLSNERGDKIGLLCINFDTSLIEASIHSLASFLQAAKPRPEVLFKGDFREEINLAIRQFLESRNIALTALTRADRIELIAALAQKGLFETRRAADHVAAALDISRATVYSLRNAAKALEAA